MRDIKAVEVEEGKSAEGWMKVKPLRKALKNWFLFRLALISPGKKNQFFYRAMGMKIGKNVQIMPMQKMDVFFPELISIGDGSVIGMDCFFACHEFNPKEFRYGSITIGKNVLIGARTFILPGVKIGDNSLVSAQTTIYKDIPENVIAFGSPLQFKPIEEKKEASQKPLKK